MQFIPMSKLQPEQRVARALLSSAERNGGSEHFFVSTRWLHTIQHDYARYLRALIQRGLLEVVQEYQFKQRCRIYRLPDPAALVVRAGLPADAVILTGRTDEERLEEIRRAEFLPRTNLATLTTTKWAHFAQPDDGRFYTEFAALPQSVRAGLTIDGEPTCEVDISACFPSLIPAVLRGNGTSGLTAELAAFETRGAAHIRTEIAEAEGIAVANVKEALARVLFAPARIGYSGEWRDSRFALNTDGEEQRKAVHGFRMRFPRIYRALRRLALSSSRSPFFAFSQIEARIRHVVKRRFNRQFGYPPESVHDGFVVKVRHKRELDRIIRGAAIDVCNIRLGTNLQHQNQVNLPSLDPSRCYSFLSYTSTSTSSSSSVHPVLLPPSSSSSPLLVTGRKNKSSCDVAGLVEHVPADPSDATQPPPNSQIQAIRRGRACADPRHLAVRVCAARLPSASPGGQAHDEGLTCDDLARADAIWDVGKGGSPDASSVRSGSTRDLN